MKKFLSVVLVVLMVFSLSMVAFASDDKITGAIKPINANVSNDLNKKAPGSKVTYPLTADMFKWRSGTEGVVGAPVTKSDISSGSVSVVLTSNDAKLVKAARIVYAKAEVAGNQETAHVEVEFANPFVSVNERNFTATIYLNTGSRQHDSRVILEGSLQNPTKDLTGGSSSENIEGGQVLNVVDNVNNLDLHIGESVYMRLNAIRGQKYYAYVETRVNSKDTDIINKNPSIANILHLSTVGLSRTGKYVDLTLYKNKFAYNEKGVYLGKTTDLIEYSDTYYLSSTDLGKQLAGSSGASSGGDTNKPDSNSGSGSSTKPSPTPIPTKPTVPSPTPLTGTIETTEATKLANDAITKAVSGGQKSAVISVKNKNAITTDALRAMASAGTKYNVTTQLQADTVVNQTIISRIYINPASAKNLTGTMKLGGYVDNANAKRAKQIFEKSFKNKIAIYSFDQNGPLNMSVSVAAKMNLSSMNKDNLYFYTYNRSTNKYYAIKKPSYFIDKSGYLRFTTSNGGDIIVSEGQLSKK